MTRTFRTDAIPLVKRAVRETDRVYSVFSAEYGKMDVVAKGSRKIVSKLAGDMEHIGVLDLFIVRGRVFDRLAGAAPREVYPSVLEEYDRRFAFLSVAAFLDRVVRPGIRDAALFALTHEFCRTLGEPRSLALAEGGMLLSLQWKLFSHLGFAPDLQRCVRCRTSVDIEQPAAFTVRHGGIACAPCRNGGALVDATPFPPAIRISLHMLLETSLSRMVDSFLPPPVRANLRTLTAAWSLMHLETEAVM